jgi:hypothetical protein
VDGETGSWSDTCETCDVDGTEGAIVIKDEMPEAISFPSIKTENEVSLWVVCEMVASHDFGPFIASNILKLLSFIPCFLLYFECHMIFAICISFLKRREFLKVITVN